MDPPVAVVLAAGKGTRMKSELPKVLIQCCGRPLVEYVLDAVEGAGISRILLVVGYRADQVRKTLVARPHVEFVEQTEQLGTGHAVAVCRDHLVDHDGAVVVVAGDSPLTQGKSIATLLSHYHDTRPACILGTLRKQDPTGLGRIVRDADGRFSGIVEEKDASQEQRRITEVNMSTYVFDSRELLLALSQLRRSNEQKEYYLTDCPGILKAAGRDVQALPVLEPREALSVNNLSELRVVEAEMRKNNAGTQNF